MTLETIAAAVAAPQPVDSDEIKLCELAKLPPLEYDRKRQEIAGAMGCRVGTLDAEVERRREPPETVDLKQRFESLWKTEPSPEPVDGVTLLDTLADEYSRKVILPKHAADALALWTTHTWTHESADASPLLVFSSPEKRCGKTSALGAVARYVRKPLPAANITPAALFRSVEKWEPALLVDEADTFLGDNDELRGLINSGHTRTSAVCIRTVGDDHEPTPFSTWCPKAIALIGKLADTLADRAIVIHMRRKLPGEKVDRQRAGPDPRANAIKADLTRWAADHLDELHRTDPDMPDGLNDRAADNWRHLLAIADLAGEDWPSRARVAAAALSGSDDDADSVRSMLLADLADLFNDRAVDRLTSGEIVAHLGGMEDRPWSEWRAGKPITARQLAKLLAPFGITPSTIRTSAGTPKGYHLTSFTDAFSRYLPSSSATPPQAAETREKSPVPIRNTANTVADESVAETADLLTCGGVADRKGIPRPEGAPALENTGPSGWRARL